MNRRFNRKRACYPAAALMAGLVPAQIIATFQVYISNRSLYRTLTEISRAGHGTIPHVWDPAPLQEPATALFGGLFFTLSVGAGMSLISFAAAWIWDRIGSRKTLVLIPMLLLWAVFLTGVNRNGFSPFSTLYFAVIPPVVFTLTLKWMPRGEKMRLKGLLHLIPIAVLGMLWGSQMEKDLFTNIRDHLLLTHPLGDRVVRFYYQYTRYPAEALKPLEQKLVKACNIGKIRGPINRLRLHKALIGHRWVEARNVRDPDLLLSVFDGKILLEDGRGKGIEIPEDAFLNDPGAAFGKFSFLLDRHRFFRRFTFYSLLIAFPITLYIFTYSLFFFFMGKWASPENALRLSTTLTFSVALMLFIWFWHNNCHEIMKEKTAPATHMRSPANIRKTHGGEIP